MINVPGETMAIADYMNAICSRFGVEATLGKSAFDDDLPWGVGDRVLSASLFRSLLHCAPRHKFRSWAASLPDTPPAVGGFAIDRA